MVRLGIVTEKLSEVRFNKTDITKPDTNDDGDTRSPSVLIDGNGSASYEEMNIYEGLVTEASPNTKIIKLITPENCRGLRVILRTQDNITINDRVKIFGYTERTVILPSKTPL